MADITTLAQADPIDSLLANQTIPGQQTRLLDFVRRKFRELQRANHALQEKVRDLEHSHEIIQTAQVGEKLCYYNLKSN